MSLEFQVCLCISQCGKHTFNSDSVAKIINLTTLPLLISCKLIFLDVGLQVLKLTFNTEILKKKKLSCDIYEMYQTCV
jgi:hypothetical protein